MENFLEILSRSQLFDSVPLEPLMPELLSIETRHLPAGEVFLEPRQENDHIYIVLDGELYVTLEPWPGHPLATLRAGDCVGELSVIDKSRPSAHVITATAATLLPIPKAVLWILMAKQQQVALNLLHILAERIRQNTVTLHNSIELQRHYRNKAEMDVLTGLHNRNWMTDIFPKQIDLSEQIGQAVSLIVLDIDNFKRVNDSHGHHVGDQVLRHLGALIIAHTRSTDLTARFGGEEIVILMPATDAHHAAQSADRIRRVVESHEIDLGNQTMLGFTVSAGVAEWYSGMSFEVLFQSADQALYSAKSAGRNRVVTNPLSCK